MTNFTIVQTEQLPALVDRLSTALANAEAENERLTRELDEANASIDAQRKEITRMVKECDGLRAKLRVAKTKGEKVEKLSSLRMKVNVLLSEIGNVPRN